MLIDLVNTVVVHLAAFVTLAVGVTSALAALVAVFPGMVELGWCIVCLAALALAWGCYWLGTEVDPLNTLPATTWGAFAACYVAAILVGIWLWRRRSQGVDHSE